MPIRSTRVNSSFSPCFHLSVVLLEQLYRFCNWQWAVVKFYNTVRSCVRSCDGVQVFVQFSYEFEHLPTELRVIDVWKNVLGMDFPSEKKSWHFFKWMFSFFCHSDLEQASKPAKNNYEKAYRPLNLSQPYLSIYLLTKVVYLMSLSC
jgi:hypothetical protein